MTMNAAAACTWWQVRVDRYRFLLRCTEVAAVLPQPEPTPVHHAPAWVAGLAHLQGHPVGVMDLGRFLGVCTLRSGPLLLPAPGVCEGWALRVHEIEPGPSAQDCVPAPPTPHPPSGGGVPESMAARARPSFAGPAWAWRMQDGSWRTGDELLLSALGRHPRVREQAA